MYQAPLPEAYGALSPDETRTRIRAAKRSLGSRVVVLGHHYQRDEIIEHADYRGDSYKLCKDAQRHPEAEFIVFCGVHFMAESADILTDKRVILPNLAAGCSMADMANILQVRSCWKQLESVLGEDMRVMPVTYINSAANLKAFVGERGGTVCTSTNAPVAVKWALEQADKVLFFPDQHLGRNTGVKLGFDPDADMALWDPFKPLGGNSADKLRAARFILWKGHCSVHKRFTVDQVLKARAEFPGVQVIVHPECELEVVRLADYVGSTEFIIKTVTAGEPATTWAVGTEINLVSRLAKELSAESGMSDVECGKRSGTTSDIQHPASDPAGNSSPGNGRSKTVFCLDPQICPCSTMYRIHPSFLLWTLENLAAGTVVNEIVVPEEVKGPARIALDRMLQLI